MNKLDLADKIRGYQKKDCFFLGIAIDIILCFGFFALGITSPFLGLLLIIPVSGYSVIWEFEYVHGRLIGKKTKDEAIAGVGFERQVNLIVETSDLPCEERERYVTLGWWINKYRK